MATMIDTLGYVKRLTAVGVSREQAEAHAEAFRDEIAAQVATKADLDAVQAHLDNKISGLEARFEGKFTLLHGMCGFNLPTSIAVLWMLVRLLMK
jgi:hypothetical protein